MNTLRPNRAVIKASFWAIVLACGVALLTSWLNSRNARNRCSKWTPRGVVEILASDSMEGRRTGTLGADRAGHFLVSLLQEFRVEPAGSNGFYQEFEVDQNSAEFPSGTEPGFIVARNVAAMVPGRNPDAVARTVMLGAHYDHVGMRRGFGGDSIFNGADDNASGVAVVIELACRLKRRAAEGPVLLLLTAAEEQGLAGARRHVNHSTVPLDRVNAFLNIEMVGRPDPILGTEALAWISGLGQSTLSESIDALGIPMVSDPRPERDFFRRGDNYAFVLRGVPAHTISSFGLHSDYHQVTDEAGRLDYEHLDAVIDAVEALVRHLAAGSAVEWSDSTKKISRH